MCVNWDDVKAYVAWLSSMTGKPYRLLSEAEWEYAARGGTRTSRYWGDDASAQCAHANGADGTLKAHYSNWAWVVASCRDGFVHTAPVGSFSSNGFGLHDVLGNVWEWVEDCWNERYVGAPADGSRVDGRRLFEARSARRFLVRPTVVPPFCVPLQEQVRIPLQQRRVSCSPDARPLNPYLFTSGVQGAKPPGGIFRGNHQEEP